MKRVEKNDSDAFSFLRLSKDKLERKKNIENLWKGCRGEKGDGSDKADREAKKEEAGRK